MDRRLNYVTSEFILAIESAYFARFHQACRSSDPKAALDSLLVWLGYWCTRKQFLTVKDFAEQLGNDELGEELKALQEAVASRPDKWSGHELYHVVARMRRTLVDK